jgi:hypothetical protein
LGFGSLIPQALAIVALPSLVVWAKGWPEPGFLNSEMNEKYTHHELEPLRNALNVTPSIKVE